MATATRDFTPSEATYTLGSRDTAITLLDELTERGIVNARLVQGRKPDRSMFFAVEAWATPVVDKSWLEEAIACAEHYDAQLYIGCDGAGPIARFM